MRGFIRKRGATWTTYWSTIDPATGKRVQHSKGGFTRKEPARPTAKGDSAREHLNSILGAVQEGTWRKEHRMTVQELLVEHWLPEKKSEGISANTYRAYRQAVEQWIVPRIGGVKIGAVTPKMVTELIETLRTTPSLKCENGLSTRSVQIAVGALKAAYRSATAAGLLGRNPLANVKTPRARSPKMRFWTADQARTFLEATRDDRFGWAWALLLTRGPRRGEVCGMRWHDVDLNAKAWHVVRARIVTEDGVVESTTKTTSSQRRIPLDDHLVALLRSHRARQAAEKLAAGGAYDDRGYLFADELGNPHYPDTLSEWFEAKLTELGLPRIRLHDTRHTAATLMLGSGVPVNVVSELLGHASPVVTLTVYGHVIPGMTDQAGAALSERLLGEAVSGDQEETVTNG